MSRTQSIARTAMIILLGAMIASGVNLTFEKGSSHPSGYSLSNGITIFLLGDYSS